MPIWAGTIIVNGQRRAMNKNDLTRCGPTIRRSMGSQSCRRLPIFDAATGSLGQGLRSRAWNRGTNDGYDKLRLLPDRRWRITRRPDLGGHRLHRRHNSLTSCRSSTATATAGGQSLQAAVGGHHAANSKRWVQPSWRSTATIRRRSARSTSFIANATLATKNHGGGRENRQGLGRAGLQGRRLARQKPATGEKLKQAHEELKATGVGSRGDKCSAIVRRARRWADAGGFGSSWPVSFSPVAGLPCQPPPCRTGAPQPLTVFATTAMGFRFGGWHWRELVERGADRRRIVPSIAMTCAHRFEFAGCVAMRLGLCPPGRSRAVEIGRTLVSLWSAMKSMGSQIWPSRDSPSPIRQ